MSEINQKLVDNVFSLIDGNGLITWLYEDCKIIQETLRKKYGIYLSINECRRFWEWRSEKWDAGFLVIPEGLRSENDIIEWFSCWMDELDVWDLLESEE